MPADIPTYLFQLLTVRDAAYVMVLADLRQQRSEVDTRIRQVEVERDRFFSDDSNRLADD